MFKKFFRHSQKLTHLFVIITLKGKKGEDLCGKLL